MILDNYIIESFALFYVVISLAPRGEYLWNKAALLIILYAL